MKLGKILVAFLIITILLSCVSCVFADINPEKYKPKYTVVDEDGGAMEIARKVVGVVNVISAIVLVGTILVLGMKYITGSIEERANYKKTMIPIAIGVILMVGTTSIINFVLNVIPSDIS